MKKILKKKSAKYKRSQNKKHDKKIELLRHYTRESVEKFYTDSRGKDNELIELFDLTLISENRPIYIKDDEINSLSYFNTFEKYRTYVLKLILQKKHHLPFFRISTMLPKNYLHAIKEVDNALMRLNIRSTDLSKAYKCNSMKGFQRESELLNYVFIKKGVFRI